MLHAGVHVCIRLFQVYEQVKRSRFVRIIIIVFEVAMKPFIVHGFTLQTEKYRLNIVLNTACDHSFGRAFEGQT